MKKEKQTFDSILDKLSEHRDTSSGLFRLFFAERTPSRGPGAGLMGIEGEWLLNSYIKGIEAACGLFSREPKWDEPKRDESDRATLNGYVPVLIFDGVNFDCPPPPFANYHYSPKYCSFIGLPSELHEPTRRAASEHAMITGAHETAHVYTHAHKRLDSDEYVDWAWFDEATAVYVEWSLHQKYSERHRFARRWINSPQLGLEQRYRGRSVGYETAWFVDYLVKKHGWEVVTDVWRYQKRGKPETPIQAIDRWFRKNKKVVFRDVLHDIKDEFASGYCPESYLTANVCPRLHNRYGNRWPCYTFNPSPGKEESYNAESGLDPLACQYYRIVLKDRPSAFRVEVRCCLPLRKCGLKAHVFAVGKPGMLGPPRALVSQGATTTTTVLGNTTDPVADADYYVLAVANVLSAWDTLGNPSPGFGGNQLVKPNRTYYQVVVSA